MKDFIRFGATLALTAVLSLFILLIASNIFIPKWVDHDMNMMSFIIKGFYKEEKNSLDVIFMGNSDTYRGIDPMVIYNEYGITSYNYVAAGQRMWMAYAMLEDSLRSQNPKVIMFNVDEVFITKQATKGNASKVYDNMEFSFNKIKAVFDTNYKKSRIKKLSHFLPILNYHSRYNELNSDDFKYAFYDYSYVEKGMDMVADIVPYTGDTDYMSKSDEAIELPEVSINYLDKMKSLCEKNGIEFVLFHVPSPDSSSYARYEAVKDYADKNSLTFLELNLYNDEIGINWEEDTSDGGDHLNLYGAEKVSKYIGKYLVDNYNLSSHKNDEKYSSWTNDYNKYLEDREMEINSAKEK
jgi:hypothetical protein